MNHSKKEVFLHARLLYQSKLTNLEKDVDKEMKKLKQEIREELDGWSKKQHQKKEGNE
jgi:hypothetical protein